MILCIILSNSIIIIIADYWTSFSCLYLHVGSRDTTCQLIGHDVSMSIGYEVSISIGHDVSMSIGHKVPMSIGHDVSMSIGHDVSMLIGHDVSMSIGHDVSMPSRISNSHKCQVNLMVHCEFSKQ